MSQATTTLQTAAEEDRQAVRDLFLRWENSGGEDPEGTAVFEPLFRDGCDENHPIVKIVREIQTEREQALGLDDDEIRAAVNAGIESGERDGYIDGEEFMAMLEEGLWPSSGEPR